MTQYTVEFYRSQRGGSLASAEAIVPIVHDLVRPRSVIDVGCGVGAWLSVFGRLGVKDVWGVDGPHVDRHLLEIPSERFVSADLRHPVRLSRRFDLAVSLEVAEHLPPECARTFVASLTGLAPLVLFSAAIPHQGGVGHVNEQWPEYWAERFAEHGYVPIDCVRPGVWRDERVEWWYAQNTILYAERARIAEDPQLRAAREASRLQPLSLVHPRKYLALLEWSELTNAIRQDLLTVVPPGAGLLLVDGELLRSQVRPDALPFPEANGHWAGPPVDDAAAHRELDRLRQAGAGFIAFAQPMFWWFEHYREFHAYLRSSFPCPLDSERLVVFDLRARPGDRRPPVDRVPSPP